MTKSINMGIPSLPSQKISSTMVSAYKMGLSTLYYGSPGTGKSQGVIAGGQKIADELKLELVVNPTSEQEASGKVFGVWLRVMSGFTPEDVNGLPYLDGVDGEKTTKFSRTGLIPTHPSAKGIVFFDELGNAEDYKMGPMQSLLTERKVGDWSVPEGVMFVLATNKPEDGTGARELPSAIRNRCCQYDVVAPTGEDFVNMMRSIDRKMHKFVEGFLLTFPAESYTFTPEKTASATLRSWENISKNIPKVDGLQEEVLLVSSMVGTEGGMKYKAWRKLSDKIKLSDIIAKPELVNDYEHDKGMLYNIALGLLEHSEKSAKNIVDVFNVLLHLTHDEFSIYIIKNMIETHNHNKIVAAINAAPNKADIQKKLLQYKDFYFD